MFRMASSLMAFRAVAPENVRLLTVTDPKS